jgi:peptide alpha-N-acetyltransferase
MAIPKDGTEPIGCVVGKIDQEEMVVGGVPTQVPTGYIGMLAVQSSYRRLGIGKALVRQVLQRMKDMGCKSVTLETEVTNTTAQRLYQDSFGFLREELLVRYYLNFNDAFRLRLWFDGV